MISKTFSPLGVADYRSLWIGQIVSVAGDRINQIAMALMVYSLTGSMLQMGIMLGIVLLPAALFGLVAGVLVDRLDRRRVMIAADLIRMVVVLAIPFVVHFGIGWAYALAFVASAVSLLFTPAKRALIPEIVNSRDLMASNSLDNASEAVAELVGLAIGGVVVATIGYSWAFGIDAATFAFSAVCISLIRHRRPVVAAPLPHVGIYAELTEGLRSIWHHDLLRELSGFYVFTAMLGQASVALCYALALERYQAGATGLAMLDAAIAVGILAGSVLIARGGMGRAGTKFLSGVAGMGVAVGLVALAYNIWIAMAFLLAAGIANMYFFIPATTLYQTHSNEAVRGRVMAAITTLTRIAMVLGTVIVGALAERMPIAWLAAALGVGGVLVAAAGSTQAALREA
ncbi:MAG: MFS transporter [Coriobacteriia bacterium]|nr:MFS transporter [Coriobacteriia bacterium]